MNTPFVKKEPTLSEQEALEVIAGRVTYDQETGHFFWKPKPDSDENSEKWNMRFAGKKVQGKVQDHKLHINHSIDNAQYQTPAGLVAWRITHGAIPLVGLNHINGDYTNCRLANLQDAIPTQPITNPELNFHGYQKIKGRIPDIVLLEYAATRINYNKETGHLTWKPKDEDSHSSAKRWNETNAGKRCGKAQSRYTTFNLTYQGTTCQMQAGMVAWFLLYGDEPSKGIVHINGDKSDCRPDNLKDAPDRKGMKKKKGRNNGPSAASLAKQLKADMVALVKYIVDNEPVDGAFSSDRCDVIKEMAGNIYERL